MNAKLELTQTVDIPDHGSLLDQVYALEAALPALVQALSETGARPLDGTSSQLIGTALLFTDVARSLPELKAILLELERRRRKENLREGRVLEVRHPDFLPEEVRAVTRQVSEFTSICIRYATQADLAEGGLCRDDQNAVRGNRERFRNPNKGLYQ